MRSVIFLVTLILWVASALAQQDEVALLVSRNSSISNRAELIRRETKELRLSTFTFDLDQFGTDTIGLLADAAKRGVKVKLNVDVYHGSLPRNAAVLKALEELGVEVKLFNPLLDNFYSLNYRNHMKSLIGSDFMILGDRNMTKDYFSRKSGNNFIGMDVLIKGDEVTKAKEHFDQVFETAQMKKKKWGVVTRPSAEKVEEAKKLIDEWIANAKKIPSPRVALEMDNLVPENLRYFGDSPGGIWSKDKEGVHRELISMINRSEKTLEFTNPYVLFTPETQDAIDNALARGVKIRVNTNSAVTTDSKLMGMAWDFHKYELVAKGIEVRELKPGQYLHAKTVVMDSKEVFVGSFNLDPRSQNLNLENGVFIKDKRVAEQLNRHNDLIRKKFMTLVGKEEIPKMTKAQKASWCVKRGMKKMISNLVYNIL